MAILTDRALNRATLDRQYLLRRSTMPALAMVEHLVGLQAQTPQTWYAGLWTRLVDFDPAVVAAAVLDREVVRIALMRGTIHLVTTADAAALRPLVEPVIIRGTDGAFGKHLRDLDLEPVVRDGRAILDEQPMIFSELGRRLALRYPGRDPAALAQAVRARAPLVQVPPRGVWGRSGTAAHATFETWTGRSLDPNPDVEAMVRRYLGAFGPATVADVQTWCGLTRLKEVLDRMRPELVTFTDERGRELFDLPDAPRPDPDVPAPLRFLYDFDNLLLSHADRSRVVTESYVRQVYPDNVMPRLILIDGFTAASWTVEAVKGTAVLTIRPFSRLSKKDMAAIEAEGVPLLGFLYPKATSTEVRFTPPT